MCLNINPSCTKCRLTGYPELVTLMPIKMKVQNTFTFQSLHKYWCSWEFQYSYFGEKLLFSISDRLHVLQMGRNCRKISCSGTHKRIVVRTVVQIIFIYIKILHWCYLTISWTFSWPHHEYLIRKVYDFAELNLILMYTNVVLLANQCQLV